MVEYPRPSHRSYPASCHRDRNSPQASYIPYLPAQPALLKEGRVQSSSRLWSPFESSPRGVSYFTSHKVWHNQGPKKPTKPGYFGCFPQLLKESRHKFRDTLILLTPVDGPVSDCYARPWRTSRRSWRTQHFKLTGKVLTIKVKGIHLIRTVYTQ